MPTFAIKSRTTGPLTLTTVDAPTREKAIAQVIDAVEDGEEVAIMQVQDVTGAVPGGATGTTGTTGATGPAR